jgi:hypothetical protein
MNDTTLYGDGSSIEIGDEVEFRGGLLLMFRKYRGRVVYVPGVSPLNPDMEADGLSWIAIEVPGKMLVRRLVDPQSHCVQRTRLIRRNRSELKVPDALRSESDT